jgi:hypothetical protein
MNRGPSPVAAETKVAIAGFCALSVSVNGVERVPSPKTKATSDPELP